jgi:hypothetical protein
MLTPNASVRSRRDPHQLNDEPAAAETLTARNRRHRVAAELMHRGRLGVARVEGRKRRRKERRRARAGFAHLRSGPTLVSPHAARMKHAVSSASSVEATGRQVSHDPVSSVASAKARNTSVPRRTGAPAPWRSRGGRSAATGQASRPRRPGCGPGRGVWRSTWRLATESPQAVRLLTDVGAARRARRRIR